LRKYNITPLKEAPFYRIDNSSAATQAKHNSEDKARQSGLNKSLPEARGSLMKQDQFATHVHIGGKASKNEKHPVPPSNQRSGTKGSEISSQDVGGDSEYLTPVCIGTPWTQYFLDFDTGSSDLWVLGNGCASEVPNPPKRNYYSPQASRTSSSLQGETWNITYADGSYASGDVFSDLLNLGGTVVKCQAIERATQCDPIFVSSPGDGLMVSYLF
jgi:Eukaryotic aspartyl protease